MTLMFKFISGKYKGGEFPLDKNVIVIGRHSDLEMVLSEDMVSRRHAKITIARNDIILEDMGSTNGTFVNGNRIKKVKLKLHDRILIGTSIAKLIESSNTGQNMEDAARVSSNAVSGSIEDIPVPEVLQLLATSKKTGILRITSGSTLAEIHLMQGLLKDVVLNNNDMEPKKILIKLIKLGSGSFEFEQADPSRFGNRLNMTLDAFLLEAAKYEDEVGLEEIDLDLEEDDLLDDFDEVEDSAIQDNDDIFDLDDLDDDDDFNLDDFDDAPKPPKPEPKQETTPDDFNLDDLDSDDDFDLDDFDDEPKAKQETKSDDFNLDDLDSDDDFNLDDFDDEPKAKQETKPDDFNLDDLDGDDDFNLDDFDDEPKAKQETKSDDFNLDDLDSDDDFDLDDLDDEPKKETEASSDFNLDDLDDDDDFDLEDEPVSTESVQAKQELKDDFDLDLCCGPKSGQHWSRAPIL